MVSVLFGCDEREPVLGEAEFAEFRESHPGMVGACLEEVRYGGYMQWRPNDPDCYELLPAQRWTGLWEHGWEWTNFCPEPAQSCNWMTNRGTWLIFADDVKSRSSLPDGVHRIALIGRRTKAPGNFGHTTSYEHLMVVDHIISLEPSES